MNREILFRGKHIHVLPGNEHLNGRWIEGYLASKDYINSPELERELLVDENTICQYTGLSDKNGRKIFEGDIVKDGNIYGAIVFDSHYAQFMIDDIHDGHQEYSDWWHEVEVIGNIFDNSELIN